MVIVAGAEATATMMAVIVESMSTCRRFFS